jgi:hypothetical protein
MLMFLFGTRSINQTIPLGVSPSDRHKNSNIYVLGQFELFSLFQIYPDYHSAVNWFTLEFF